MPINISQSSTIEIAAVFFSSAGVLTVPTSATVTIVYPLLSSPLTTTSCAIGMTPNNSTFIANWGVGVSALGIVTYSVVGAGQVTPITGTWRVTP